MVSRQPRPLSIGVLNGMIIATGNDLPFDAKEVIDLGDKTIFPGFNDAHCHTVWYGLSLGEIDCNQLSNLDDLYGALSAAAASLGEDDWVLASGFNQSRLGGYPDIDKLNQICGNKPLFIRHTSGHSCIVNDVALEKAGLVGQSSGLGGAIVFDDNGKFTGLLEEKAQEDIQALFLPRSQSEIVQALDRATQNYAAEGITSFTEAGIGGGWIGHSDIEMAAYQSALAESSLHARAQLMPVSDSLHSISGNKVDSNSFGLDLGIRSGFGGDHLSIGPMKIFIDGSMLALTSAVTKPFETGKADNYGYFQAPEQLLTEKILSAAGSGWAVAAHAIGDRAVELALDSFEQAIAMHGAPPMPHRIEHGGIVSDEQLARSVALGVRVVSQPGFLPKLGAQMREAIGSRSQISNRIKSYLDAGIEVAGSSDRPVANGAPMSVIQSFVERTDDNGEAFSPSERVDVLTALRCYTVGSAHVTGSWAKKGSLEPGKLADLVVLETDPASVQTVEISQIRINMTLLGGIKTFEK